MKPDRGYYNSPGREDAPTGGAVASISFCFSDSASGATSADAAGWPEAAPDTDYELFGPGAGAEAGCPRPPKPISTALLLTSTSIT